LSDCKKDWDARAHERVLIGIADSMYLVYVPDTHILMKISNVLADEYAKCDGSSNGLQGTSPHPPLEDAYELADFTEYVDNESGLKYRVAAIRK
jgi:hypothetical protein